jgi:hypothetical protein
MLRMNGFILPLCSSLGFLYIAWKSAWMFSKLYSSTWRRLKASWASNDHRSDLSATQRASGAAVNPAGTEGVGTLLQPLIENGDDEKRGLCS